ncbi:MAG: sugar-transfer associated ATP-grasp domain-containing protein [Neomegalonema sp.]
MSTDVTDAPVAAAATALETKAPITQRGLKATVKLVESKTGRPAAEMLAEATKLAYGRNKLQPEEYFDLGLFDPALSKAEREAFVGHKKSAIVNRSLNGVLGKSASTIDDKLKLSALLRGFGLGATETQALVDKTSGGPLKSLATPDDAAAFLREQAVYPLFGKPKNSSLSLGAASIDRFEEKEDSLVHHSGVRTKVETFVKEVFEAYGETGYIFQSRLGPHPDLATVSGPAVGTVRGVTLHRGSHIDVLYALWKAPALGATADNFWRGDNMIVDIDAETGRTRRCQRGTGAHAEELQNHPGTGAAMINVQMPMWPELRQLVRASAWIFPDVPLLGWDVAITPDGPMIIEGNTSPHHMLHQMAARRGLLTPDFISAHQETKARITALKESGEARSKSKSKGWRKNYIRNLIWGGSD